MATTDAKEELLFLKFSQLPGELQNIIWSLSLLNPRVVTIVSEKKGINTFLKCFDPPPGQLYACRASRDIALQRYKLMFSEQLEFPIYFDVEQDWLHFDQVNSIRDIVYKTEYTSSWASRQETRYSDNSIKDIRRIAVNPLLSTHFSTSNADRSNRSQIARFFDWIRPIAEQNLHKAIHDCGNISERILLHRNNPLETVALMLIVELVRALDDNDQPRTRHDKIPKIRLMEYGPKGLGAFDEISLDPKFDECVNPDPASPAKNVLLRHILQNGNAKSQGRRKIKYLNLEMNL